MAAKQELVEYAKLSHDNALQVVGMLLNTISPPVVGPVNSSMTVDQILSGTIGSVSTGLLDDLIDVPDISDKLSKNLDDLVKKLRGNK